MGFHWIYRKSLSFLNWHFSSKFWQRSFSCVRNFCRSHLHSFDNVFFFWNNESGTHSTSEQYLYVWWDNNICVRTATYSKANQQSIFCHLTNKKWCIYCNKSSRHLLIRSLLLFIILFITHYGPSFDSFSKLILHVNANASAVVVRSTYTLVPQAYNYTAFTCNPAFYLLNVN